MGIPMIDPELRLPIEAGMLHLHSLGPRAVSEFTIGLFEPVGELELLLRELDRWRRITPAMVRMAGGDRFPRRLLVVPTGRRSA